MAYHLGGKQWLKNSARSSSLYSCSLSRYCYSLSREPFFFITSNQTYYTNDKILNQALGQGNPLDETILNNYNLLKVEINQPLGSNSKFYPMNGTRKKVKSLKWYRKSIRLLEFNFRESCPATTCNMRLGKHPILAPSPLLTSRYPTAFRLPSHYAPSSSISLPGGSL